eukprot:5277228-Heterocapsa_arctica.AAC.1
MALLRVSNVDVAEVYSPQKMTKTAPTYGLKPGQAMDLNTGWDFIKQEDGDSAENYARAQMPWLLIGSLVWA